MRSYGQFCALAKALDAVGDRWSLLIVRELLLLGPCRYTDLLRGLPGIATNLLADRLRDLEAAGVVRREAAGPPIATSLVHLTPRGEALRGVIRELGRWGAPLLTGSEDGKDAFRGYWIALPLELYYYDQTPDRPPVTIEARFPDETMTITVDGAVRAQRGNTTTASAGSPAIQARPSSRAAPLTADCAQGQEVAGRIVTVASPNTASADATVATAQARPGSRLAGRAPSARDRADRPRRRSPARARARSARA